MPRKSTLTYHLEGQPTHPLIPTRKYVRVNKKFANGYIGNHSLFRGYPYKTCPNKHRTATVKAKEMVHNHAHSLTQGQWGEILSAYFKNVYLYLMQGYVYKIPNGWLGQICFIKKRKAITIDHDRTRKLGQVVKHKDRWINGHAIQFNWWKKKFAFQSLWKIRFPNANYGSRMYHDTMENPSLIYRMNNARRTNKY